MFAHVTQNFPDAYAHFEYYILCALRSSGVTGPVLRHHPLHPGVVSLVLVHVPPNRGTLKYYCLFLYNEHETITVVLLIAL